MEREFRLRFGCSPPPGLSSTKSRSPSLPGPPSPPSQPSAPSAPSAPSQPSQTPTPLKTPKTLKKQYSEHELRAIGQKCAKAGPPVCLVLGPLLYDVRRDKETESPFQGQMLRLMKLEEAKASTDARLRDLEETVKVLVGGTTPGGVEERLKTVQGQLDALQNEMSFSSQRLVAHDKRFAAVDDSFRSLRTGDASTAMDRTDSHSGDHACDSEPVYDLATQHAHICTMNEGIGVLFEERNALSAQLQELSKRHDELEANERQRRGEHVAQLAVVVKKVYKLEDFVRALTAQKPELPPPQSQLLPVRSAGGGTAPVMDLCVPKGYPLVPHQNGRENAPPQLQIKPFVPGKQWSA